MGRELTTTHIISGILILLIIIVGVVAYINFGDEIRAFINSINPWADDLKDETTNLVDAYNFCKGVDGDNCLCNSNINLLLKPGSTLYVESLKKDKNDPYGIWVTPGDLGSYDVQHCLLYAKYDPYTQGNDEFKWIAESRPDFVSALEYYNNRVLEKDPSYPNGVPIETEPIKLFKHYDKQKDVTYLCLVLSSVAPNLKTCEEVMICDPKDGNMLCQTDEVCPGNNIDLYYSGQGACCRQACQKVANQQQQNQASALYQKGLALFLQKNYQAAYSKFEEVYSNYKDTTVTDNSLHYMGFSLIKLGRLDEGLKLWRDLLIEFNDLKDTEYGNAFTATEVESNKLLSCDKPGFWTKDNKGDCLQRKDSSLNRCFWNPNKVTGGIGFGKCESCEGQYSCYNKNQYFCEESFCMRVGYKGCDWVDKSGITGDECVPSDMVSRVVKCEDLTKYGELVCDLEIDYGFSYHCEWDSVNNKCGFGSAQRTVLCNPIGPPAPDGTVECNVVNTVPVQCDSIPDGTVECTVPDSIATVICDSLPDGSLVCDVPESTAVCDTLPSGAVECTLPDTSEVVCDVIESLEPEDEIECEMFVMDTLVVVGIPISEPDERGNIVVEVVEETDDPLDPYFDVINYAKENSIMGRTCLCGDSCEDYMTWIQEYSNDIGADPLLVLSLIMHESNCQNVQCRQDGSQYSCGLMQTNKDNYLIGEDPNSAEDGIKVGVRILKEKYDYFKHGSCNSKDDCEIYECNEWANCEHRCEQSVCEYKFLPTGIWYSGWDTAVRAYNGWGLGGANNYVEEVNSRYNTLKQKYNEFLVN